MYKKGKNSLYFLSNLRSFNVCNKMSHAFHMSEVKRATCFAATCSGSSIRASDSKKLSKLIKKASSVLGTGAKPLELIVQQKMLHKLMRIIDNTTSTHVSDKTAKCIQSEASSAPLQQEVIPASNNHMQQQLLRGKKPVAYSTCCIGPRR